MYVKIRSVSVSVCMLVALFNMCVTLRYVCCLLDVHSTNYAKKKTPMHVLALQNLVTKFLGCVIHIIYANFNIFV